jgi:hypothetical protein
MIRGYLGFGEMHGIPTGVEQLEERGSLFGLGVKDFAVHRGWGARCWIYAS